MDQQATESPPVFGYPGMIVSRPAAGSAFTRGIRHHLAGLGPWLLVGDGVTAAMLFVGFLSLTTPGASGWVASDEWGVSPVVALGAWTAGWLLALWYARAYSNQGTLAAAAARVAVAAGMLLSSACVLLFVGGRATGLGPVLLGLVVSQALVATALRWTLGPDANLTWPGTPKRYVLLVGAGVEAQSWAERMMAQPVPGVEIVGCVSDDGRNLVGDDRLQLGRLSELPTILRQHVVDEIAVYLPARRWARGAWAISVAREAGKAVAISVPQPEGSSSDGNGTGSAARQTITLDPARDHRIGRAIKRAMDISLSVMALVVLSPLLISVAFIVLLSDGRPVLFVQRRVGLNGRMFGTYKFRTMVRDAEARLQEVAAMNRISGPALQVDNDPRVTRVGRWLRKTSIDELPQLLNTLRGDMSIVGPRPAPTVEVDRYEGWHCRRLSAKPGITGLAQVEIRQYDDFDERAHLDIRYIDAWSLWLDIRIILKTVPTVLRGSGR